MILPFAVAAYLIGSVSFALWVGKSVKGIDIRQHGSGNLGSTNVFRVIGKKWGLTVLALDAFKGYFAVSLPGWILGEVRPFVMIAAGIAVILGHTYPCWLKFKGGKGVATSLGVFLGLCPLPTSLAFAFWILIFSIFRIVSLASLAAVSIFPILFFVLYRDEPVFPWLFPLILLLAVFIWYTHKENFKRLLKGEEKKLI